MLHSYMILELMPLMDKCYAKLIKSNVFIFIPLDKELKFLFFGSKLGFTFKDSMF